MLKFFSSQAKVGDELDVIKGFTPENPNFLTVTRVEVLKVQLNEEEDRFLVKVRKTKSLVVDNYDDKNKFCMV